MKSIIKKKFIERKLARMIKQNGRKDKDFVNYEKVNRILLLAELLDIASYDRLKKIGKIFTSDGKKVDMVLFVHDKTTHDFLSTGSNAALIAEHNFSISGIPDNYVQTNLQGYDLLLNMNEASTLFTDYLTLLAGAKLKAGSAHHNNGVLDFMVDTGDRHNIEFLAEQIKFYLRTINAK